MGIDVFIVLLQKVFDGKIAYPNFVIPQGSIYRGISTLLRYNRSLRDDKVAE